MLVTCITEQFLTILDQQRCVNKKYLCDHILNNVYQLEHVLPSFAVGKFEHSGAEKSERSVLRCGIFFGIEIHQTLSEVLRRDVIVLLVEIVSLATTYSQYFACEHLCRDLTNTHKRAYY